MREAKKKESELGSRVQGMPENSLRFLTHRRSCWQAGPLPQPEAHVMPPSLRFGIVLESGPVVQDPAIVNEEHVPRLEAKLHAQRLITQDRVEDIERAALGGG